MQTSCKGGKEQEIQTNVGIKTMRGSRGNFLIVQKPLIIRHFENRVYNVCTQFFTLNFPRLSIAIFIEGLFLVALNI